MVGLHKRFARQDVDLIVVIGHSQQASRRQVTRCQLIGRFEQHFVLIIGRQIENAHRQIVMKRVRQTVGEQLAHADHRRDITERLLLTLMDHGSHQKHPARVGRFGADQVQRLRHRQIVQLIGTHQRVTAHRLREQVVTQRRAELALGLAVQHRHVFIAGRSQLQFAMGIQFANGEIVQAVIPHALLKRRALGATDLEGERIGLGTQ